MRTCPNCGAKASFGQIFCENCGAELPKNTVVQDSNPFEPGNQQNTSGSHESTSGGSGNFGSSEGNPGAGNSGMGGYGYGYGAGPGTGPSNTEFTEGVTGPLDKRDRTTAILSYITIVGFIVAWFYIPKEERTPYVMFHLNQGLVLGICNLILSLTEISGLLSLALLILTIMGLIGAINNTPKEVPLLGKIRILK